MNITIHPTAPKYRNKNGNEVFRYLVNGSKSELADYAKVKGEFHKIDEDTNKSLFFTTRYVGKSAELRKTSDGKDFVADDTEISMFASLVKQHGIDVAKYIWEQEKRKPVEKPTENE